MTAHDPFTCRVCQRAADHLYLGHGPGEECHHLDGFYTLHLGASPEEAAGHDRELRAAARP